MKISEQGLDFIKSFEGLRLTAYWDPNGGVWTIGWGHTRGVRRGQVITKAQAERFIRDDLAPIERHLTADLGEDGVLQCQFDALCSWIFNLRDGIRQYNNSTLRRKLKSGDYKGAADEFPRWCHSGGHVLPGLVRRREAERKMFLQAGGVTALFVGVLVILAMGLAIAFFREMVL